MSKIGTILYNHILKNKREYLIILILFFIGIILGVLFANSLNEEEFKEVSDYLNNLVLKIKESENINLFFLLKKSIIYNLCIAILLWFGATTIAGIPIVHGTIMLKGFSLGYTISSIISCFGIGKGLIIVLSVLILHNIIFLPTIFAISISRYKAI